MEDAAELERGVTNESGSFGGEIADANHPFGFERCNRRTQVLVADLEQ